MDSVETRIKTLAKHLGANLVGITTADALGDGPPSADPRYLLPSANAVISFAVSLDKEKAKHFIRKQHWRPHCRDRKKIAQRLYRIGDALAEHLRSKGHASVNVDLNNNYRPEPNAADVTEMTAFHPEFSHRYAALASGVGRLGWSGNLLTREYGALVELGSVLTAARLSADTPIADDHHPCDRCKMCSHVCPVAMIHPDNATHVTIAGITETISQKRPNTCCWIGCTGYEGLAPSRTWSNWSPYRLAQPLPEEKGALDALCIRLQKLDPQMKGAANSFDDYRRAVFDPDWFYYTVCGFCRNVCAPSRRERVANRKRIIHSGTAALKLDGSHVVADENACAVTTPFGLQAVIAGGQQLKQNTNHQPWPGQFPLDREVIEFLRRKNDSAGDSRRANDICQ